MRALLALIVSCTLASTVTMAVDPGSVADWAMVGIFSLPVVGSTVIWLGRLYWDVREMKQLTRRMYKALCRHGIINAEDEADEEGD